MMALDERSLQREYDNALIELQKRFEVVRNLSGGDPADLLAIDRARESYERARLVWLSCELRLRSAGISGPFQFRHPKGIWIYSATEKVKHSLVSLLKARGYLPSAVETVDELYAAARISHFAAAVAYIEPAMRRAPSFVKYLERVSEPLPLIALSGNLVAPRQPDAVPPSDCTSPLRRLFLALDSAIQSAAGSRSDLSR